MNLLTQETCPLSEDIRLIPLTQGQFAIVWASDYDWLTQWKWFAAWNKYTKSFYAVRSAPPAKGQKNQQRIQMSRFILGLERGDPRQADHADHNTLNNCRSNLRATVRANNMKNRRTPNTSITGVKWVSPVRYKDKLYGYKVQIQSDGKYNYLGIFPTFEEARTAALNLGKELHKEFMCEG